MFSVGDFLMFPEGSKEIMGNKWHKLLRYETGYICNPLQANVAFL